MYIYFLLYISELNNTGDLFVIIKRSQLSFGMRTQTLSYSKLENLARLPIVDFNFDECIGGRNNSLAYPYYLKQLCHFSSRTFATNPSFSINVCVSLVCNESITQSDCVIDSQ